MRKLPQLNINPGAAGAALAILVLLGKPALASELTYYALNSTWVPHTKCPAGFSSRGILGPNVARSEWDIDERAVIFDAIQSQQLPKETKSDLFSKHVSALLLAPERGGKIRLRGIQLKTPESFVKFCRELKKGGHAWVRELGVDALDIETPALSAKTTNRELLDFAEALNTWNAVVPIQSLTIWGPTTHRTRDGRNVFFQGASGGDRFSFRTPTLEGDVFWKKVGTLPKLTHLKVVGVDLQSDVFESLLEVTPAVSNLEIAFSYVDSLQGIDAETEQKFSKYFSHVTSLNLNSSILLGEANNLLNRFIWSNQSIKDLDLSYSQLAYGLYLADSDIGFGAHAQTPSPRSIADMKQLEVLRLRGNVVLVDNLLTGLSALTELRELDVTRTENWHDRLESTMTSAEITRSGLAYQPILELPHLHTFWTNMNDQKRSEPLLLQMPQLRTLIYMDARAKIGHSLLPTLLSSKPNRASVYSLARYPGETQPVRY